MAKIHHVGILCSPTGYEKLMSIIDRIGGFHPHQELYVPEFACKCILHGNIEYIIPDKPGPLQRWFDDNQQNGVCQHHFALQVDDIEAAMERAKRLHHRLVTAEPVAGVGNTLVNFIHPADVGVMIELVQVL